jgi:hypothetical protein
VRRYAGGPEVAVDGPAIVLATRGAVAVGEQALTAGHAAFVAVGTTVSLAGAGDAYVARAGGGPGPDRPTRR